MGKKTMNTKMSQQKCLVRITALKRNEDGEEMKLESKEGRVSCREKVDSQDRGQV